MTMNADRIINGSFGQLYVGTTAGDVSGLTPEFLAQVRSVSARVAIARQDINPVGDSWTRYKKTAYSGDGSFVLWKATSKFIKAMDVAIKAGGVPRLMLKVILDDPESFTGVAGDEVVELYDVKIWEVPIGFDSGELVEETIQFTFEGFSVIDEITGDVKT